MLKINRDSRFFAGLRELEMDNRIRPLLNRYADFDFRIDMSEWEVSFSREVESGGVATIVEDIKVSRGEENIFIWCFFPAIVQLVVDGAEAYKWVRFMYIDDPISSLDEHNAVMVAHHLAQVLNDSSKRLRIVVSSHHVLFFNVLSKEMKRPRPYFLTREPQPGGFVVRETVLRRVMEQTACFFGYAKWEECIKPDAHDPNGTVYKRVIDLMSHGDYSLYEPRNLRFTSKG